jgi:hypothetical protein
VKILAHDFITQYKKGALSSIQAEPTVKDVQTAFLTCIIYLNIKEMRIWHLSLKHWMAKKTYTLELKASLATPNTPYKAKHIGLSGHYGHDGVG